MTRQEFLAIASQSALGSFSTNALAHFSSRFTDNHYALARRAAQIIRAYDQQGVHRTGTRVDEQSARWLAAQVRASGAAPELQSFTLERVDPLACYLHVGKRRIEALPAFDGAFTNAQGLRGKLGLPGTEAEIALAEFSPNAEYVPGYEKLRRESKHRALVIITQSTRPGLCPINARYFTAPYGPPVLQVSSAEGEWLKQQANQKADTHFIAHAKRTRAQAFNVTAKLKGADANLPPLVVMTPRSGWQHCTSERGGGLVCWLEAMRAIAQSKSARDVFFIASSGHELGHLGLHHFIESNPELVKRARAWLHFGANIGAAQEPMHRLQSSDDELEKAALTAMQGASVKINEIRPRGSVPFGEAGNIHRGGGRYVSLLGTNALFHHPADRWPEAVDVAAVSGYAQAFARLAIMLAQND